MDHTIVAVFDSREHAARARDDLVALGIPQPQVHMHAATEADLHDPDTGRPPVFTSDGDSDRKPEFFARLFGLDDDLDEDGRYADAVRRGGCIVAVDGVSDALFERASRLLERHGALDVNVPASR